jgi:hypothetical protein
MTKYSYAASKRVYDTLYANGPAKPTTPDETQKLDKAPRYNTWYKGALTRSEIYERMFPDGQTCALRIDGPSDGFITFDNTGSIKIVTGIHDPEVGAGSGKLSIQTYGQQQQHLERTDIEYSAGTDGEGQALNIIAYGDVVESATGSERHIYAQKIIISAAEELILAGQTVKIQANNGAGTIELYAGSVEKTTTNDKETVTGQKMTFGASETTNLQFDPRASVNWVSPGHVNWKILGDYKQWVGGVSQQVVAGGKPVPPLIKDRSETYQVSTLLGGIRFTAATEDITFASVKGGLYGYSVSGIDLVSTTGDILISSGTGGIDITSGKDVNITATANVAIQGALILLN